MKSIICFSSLLFFLLCCQSKQPDTAMVRLITLDPGHFHAALVQKTMYAGIDSNIYVYAPGGQDLQEHLARIASYNQRADNPTRWNEVVYSGSDFLEKMLLDKKGNVVVLAGNNQKKTEYIKASVDAGLNVLADKPMAINALDFEILRQSFAEAETKKLILYDIMTERSEITTILQRELSMNSALFGILEKGTPENPAVTKESVHHFYKYVSGSALKRPAWFFDTEQQGEGIVDVTTHLVDLIQWECFPEQSIDFLKDIRINTAKRWPTPIMLSQFTEVTGLKSYPEFLQKEVQDTMLNVYSNGEINYVIKGVHAKVSVTWNYKAPEGTGDTHYSIMRGTKANLIIRQGKDQNYKPILYIEPLIKDPGFSPVVDSAMIVIQKTYPGITAVNEGSVWKVNIPDQYKISHEDHFAQVMQRFLEYLKNGNMPAWEVPNMLAKYYTTTRAFEMASQK
ncbi:MAG TPA: putative oxidoreductase C-terminal domain-containing protein [Bacteroidales bacterium]|nr:putative oxidoreductase C-terminal domain-containing protein [Bacteroidales bacterium]